MTDGKRINRQALYTLAPSGILRIAHYTSPRPQQSHRGVISPRRLDGLRSVVAQQLRHLAIARQTEERLLNTMSPSTTGYTQYMRPWSASVPSRDHVSRIFRRRRHPPSATTSAGTPTPTIHANTHVSKYATSAPVRCCLFTLVRLLHLPPRQPTPPSRHLPCRDPPFLVLCLRPVPRVDTSSRLVYVNTIL